MTLKQYMCVCVHACVCVCVCMHACMCVLLLACMCLHLCFTLYYLKLVIYCFGQLLHAEEKRLHIFDDVGAAAAE